MNKIITIFYCDRKNKNICNSLNVPHSLWYEVYSKYNDSWYYYLCKDVPSFVLNKSNENDSEKFSD